MSLTSKFTWLQISQNLYKSYIENVNLFKGCSTEFINQIVSHILYQCQFLLEQYSYCLLLKLKEIVFRLYYILICLLEFEYKSSESRLS